MADQLRILVIEDDIATAELIQFVLEEDGYAVQTVGRGAGVFPAVESFRPDLITIDINLPDVDGLHLYRQLRANAATHATPVIFISVAEGHREEGLRLGAESFVSKPFTLDDLSHIVHQAIHKA